MSEAAPVDAGEEGVRAQTLVAEPFPRHTQQTLHEIHELRAGFGIVRELQVTLEGRETTSILDYLACGWVLYEVQI